MPHHPCPKEFRQAIRNSQSRDREIIARLWLSEGIPYAFREKASIYDELRYWLSDRLDVNCKDVTIVGSGRIGFSMKPSKYGAQFGGGDGSDLDFSIVNRHLFDLCAAEALSFKLEFESNRLNPNSNQRKYWSDTVGRIQSHLSAGFVDTFSIPGMKDISPSILLVKDGGCRG